MNTQVLVGCQSYYYLLAIAGECNVYYDREIRIKTVIMTNKDYFTAFSFSIIWIVSTKSESIQILQNVFHDFNFNVFLHRFYKELVSHGNKICYIKNN